VRRGRRLSWGLTVIGLLLVAVAVTGLAVRGDSGDGSGTLAWSKGPRVFTPPRLPQDRVLTGRVRNDSVRRIRLRPADLRLADARGREVPGTARFVESYLHGLYPPTREPERLPESELRRTGRLAVIEPGASVPLTVAWRRDEGTAPPERLDYGRGSLPLPER
jgi:hypothetical protein